MDRDILLVDRSPFLIFNGDDEDDDFDEMVARNSLLVDALGFPLTEMENYLDCLSDRHYDIDVYLDDIEEYMRRLGV